MYLKGITTKSILKLISDSDFQQLTRLNKLISAWQIYDYANPRYEVPVPLNLPSSPSSTSQDRLYEVSVQTQPFGIQVRRKSTGTVMWATATSCYFISLFFL